MPRTDDHRSVAERNEAFADSLVITGQFEWAITAYFYAAAHYGRALVAALGQTAFISHSGFESDFHRLVRDRALYAYYRDMKMDSQRARYDCVRYSAAEVETFHKNLFEPWRNEISRRLRGFAAPRPRR